MYKVKYSGQFKKSLKLCKRRGLNMDLIHEAITLLVNNGWLPTRYRPHVLSGNYRGIWECHIAPDWLLLWTQDNDALTLMLVDTGTHSDLF